MQLETSLEEGKLYLLYCKADQDQAPRISDLLQELAPWGWQEIDLAGSAGFQVHVRGMQQAGRLKHRLQRECPGLELGLQQEQEQDWTQAWRKYFHPVRIQDRFLILPAWQAKQADDPDLIQIHIQPQMAFGTGHHASTTLCLQALAQLHKQGDISTMTEFLDLGTGSGILAIACAKLGLTGLALDNDPQAVQNARHNLELNQAQGKVALGVAEMHALSPGINFGLILANILAGPLVYMAEDLVSRLKPGGRLILSGILQEQEGRVAEAYKQQGLAEPRILRDSGWSGLILQRGR
ncbi:MAG: 50S ribosomal protein L11 methyltransferase [Desulfohalobiaceae bacterium]